MNAAGIPSGRARTATRCLPPPAYNQQELRRALSTLASTATTRGTSFDRISPLVAQSGRVHRTQEYVLDPIAGADVMSPRHAPS